MKIFLVQFFTMSLFFSSGVFAETGFEKTPVTPAKECPDLTCVRNNIDLIDEQIVQLIGKRLTYVKQARVLKKNKRPIYDAARETIILKRVSQLAEQQEIPVSVILNVYKTLLAQANLYEQQDEDK